MKKRIKIIETAKGMQVVDGKEGGWDGRVGLENLSFKMVPEATVSILSGSKDKPEAMALVDKRFFVYAEAEGDGIKIIISIHGSSQLAVKAGDYTFNIRRDGAGSVLEVEEENVGVFAALRWIFFKPVLSGLVQEVLAPEGENCDFMAMIAQQFRAILVTRYEGKQIKSYKTGE